MPNFFIWTSPLVPELGISCFYACYSHFVFTGIANIALLSCLAKTGLEKMENVDTPLQKIVSRYLIRDNP